MEPATPPFQLVKYKDYVRIVFGPMSDATLDRRRKRGTIPEPDCTQGGILYARKDKLDKAAQTTHQGNTRLG